MGWRGWSRDSFSGTAGLPCLWVRGFHAESTTGFAWPRAKQESGAPCPKSEKKVPLSLSVTVHVWVCMGACECYLLNVMLPLAQARSWDNCRSSQWPAPSPILSYNGAHGIGCVQPPDPDSHSTCAQATTMYWGWQKSLGQGRGEAGRQQEKGMHMSGGFKPPAHVLLSHWTSLTEHRIKDKLTKNFNIAMQRIKPQTWGPLLSTGACKTALVINPRSQPWGCQPGEPSGKEMKMLVAGD